MKHPRLYITLALAAALLWLAPGCDYPEQGYYQLTGLDARLNIAWRMPFMVEELVDDTHMTYGFNVLLPADGALVEVPLENGEELTRRYWLLALADADTLAGDLQLELAHSAERLSFTGGYRAVGTGPADALAGFAAPEEVAGRTRLIPNGEWPPLHETLAQVAYLELRTITRTEFINAAGGTPEELERIAPAPLEEMEVRAVAGGGGVGNTAADVAAGSGEGAAGQGSAGSDDGDDDEERKKQGAPPLGGRKHNSRSGR